MRRELSRLTAAGFFLMIGGCWSAAARADDTVAPGDLAAIQQVITSQEDAFQHDDSTKAFGYATPELQTMFGDATNFMSLVKRGYQPVYRPKSFTFNNAHPDGDSIVQEASVVGPDGLLHTAIYTMERQPDGTWRIAACQLIDRPSISS
jgi:hypothetical protein